MRGFRDNMTELEGQSNIVTAGVKELRNKDHARATQLEDLDIEVPNLDSAVRARGEVLADALRKASKKAENEFSRQQKVRV